MDFKTFKELSKVTAPFNAAPKVLVEYRDFLCNYTIGLSGEWFELKEEINKVDLQNDVPMELVNKIDKEVGDVLHYAVNLLNALEAELVEEKLNKDVSREEAEKSIGAVQEMVKKHLFHKHDLDEAEFTEELHNVIAHLNCGFKNSIPNILDKNIEKLRTRYPKGFSSEASIARVDTK